MSNKGVLCWSLHDVVSFNYDECRTPILAYLYELRVLSPARMRQVRKAYRIFTGKCHEK
jgi:hypothetical protein